MALDARQSPLGVVVRRYALAEVLGRDSRLPEAKVQCIDLANAKVFLHCKRPSSAGSETAVCIASMISLHGATTERQRLLCVAGETNRFHEGVASACSVPFLATMCRDRYSYRRRNEECRQGPKRCWRCGRRGDHPVRAIVLGGRLGPRWLGGSGSTSSARSPISPPSTRRAGRCVSRRSRRRPP